MRANHQLACRSSVLFLALLISAMVVASPASATTAAPLGASPSFRWAPDNPNTTQTYWAQRHGEVTSAEFASARAEAARLPKAAQLPPVTRTGPVGYLPGGPSGAWQAMGPAPTSVSVGGGQYTNISGRVSALAVDPTNANVVYLGAAEGGVWKTTNGGANWTPLTDLQQTLATGAIAIDPNNHNTIYVGTGFATSGEGGTTDEIYGDGVLKSTDGGVTWTLEGQATFGTRQIIVTKLVVNPLNSDQLFVATSSGLYVSNDAGVTYTVMSALAPAPRTHIGPSGPPPFIDDLGINATTSPITLYAVLAGTGVWRSTTGGTSWNQLTNGLTPSNGWYRAALAVAPSNPSVIYVMAVDGFKGNVYLPSTYNGGFYTTDGGTTWHQMTSLNQNFTDGGLGAQGWYDLFLAVDPHNDETVYGGGVDIAVTTNARGATGNWQNITNVYGARGTGGNNSYIHPGQHAIAFPPCAASPCPAWFGNDGGVYYSSNTTNADPTTVTYTDLNTAGLSIALYTGGDVGPNYANQRLALGGSQVDGATLFTGNPTQPLINLGASGFSVIDNQHPSVMYTQGPGISLLKSTNSGATWNDAKGGGTLAGNTLLSYIPYALDRSNDQHLVAGTNAVYETTNGATSWYQSSQTFNDYVSSVAVDPANSNFVYAGTSTGSVIWTNQGDSGTQHTYNSLLANNYPVLTDCPINAIAIDPTDASGQTAFIATGNVYGGHYSVSGDHIFLASAGALQDVSGSLPHYPINSVLLYYSGTTRVVVVGSDLGVFFTPNDGGAWYALNNGLPNAPVSQLAMDSEETTLVAYTFGRGAWSIDIPETNGGTGDTPAIYRPSQTTFYLRNSLTTGPADESVTFGNATDTPVVGDWNGDGVDTVGIYRSSTATFYLKDSNTPGAPIAYHFTFGLPGDIPIVGDWTGSGHDGVGVFRPSNGIIYLRESLSTGPGTYSMVFGVPGDVPVAGDWSGQGHDTVGIYRPSVHQFFLTNTNCNCIPTVNYVVTFGVAGDVPFTGDWTHSDKTGLGIFRTSNGQIYLRNDATTTGFADFSLVYGIANDVPLAGHFNTAEPTLPHPGSAGAALSKPAGKAISKPALPTVPSTYPRAARSVNLPRERAV